jgi:hypothetical protein
MTTHADAIKAIGTEFHTLVENGFNLHVQYDNEAEAKQEISRPSELDPVKKLWCRFSIRPGESSQTTIGRQVTERTVGVAFAQLFSQLGEGDKDINEMAVSIKNLFKRRTANGITYLTPSIITVGRVNEVWQTNVQIPFYFWEIS